MTASKSVHMVMIDTYIRLYLTHADLQINISVNIKYQTVNLIQVFIFTANVWIFFPIGACDLCLYCITLLLFKHV